MAAYRSILARLLAVLVLPGAAAGVAQAQDLYDTTVLRTFAIQFDDPNWLQLLRNNYASQTLILADLVVDGVTYPDVGVRIRGNTSYTALPAGSEKFSLKIDVDFTDPDADVMGYNNINLNNGFRDPTFLREVTYNNFVAQLIPNPRANHVLVTLNGQNWGVYINVQQPNKSMLRDYFSSDDGVRINCANNPNGPGLRYNGTSPAGYTAYEIQDDGGLANPLQTLIDTTNAITNTPLVAWPYIDGLFAIDPSTWSVVLENLLTDDDSYVNKGCDFMTYRDPVSGRMHLLQRDANETFTAGTWSITRNFTSTTKPVLSRVLAVPELRQRYMAHYRTARANLSWAYFAPIFSAHQALIDAAVQADPKRLYSYEHFLQNVTTQVTLPGGGLAGGNIVGLQQFINSRVSTLAAVAELNASGPAIASAQATNDTPEPAEPVFITAAVAPAGSAVAQVQLYFRPSPAQSYQRVAMLDDGASGDGAPGDGVYGALLPVAGDSGQQVAWYIAATAGNAFGSLSFRPALAERGPNLVEYDIGGTDGMRITEWMYSGASGEFVEFTNLSGQPIDLTGWSMDDDNATPGGFSLSAAGVLQPGESLLVTEALATDFRTAWGLAASVKVIGELGVASGNNFGRNDQIHLFDAANVTQDRLFFGDQNFPGSIRTQNRSGQAPCAAIGENDVLQWQLSTVGDVYGSAAATSGDVGTPGSFVAIGCAGDTIFVDGFELP
jgi:hypothetical protein